jgi:cold shock CspA family protein
MAKRPDTTFNLVGTIKSLHKEKSFGFLIDSQGVEYFFHRSGLRVREAWDILRVGQLVRFTSVDSAKGPRAEDLVIPDEAA